MLNITFIIGNGFDLQLGLKTRYTDFLDEYVLETESDNEDIIKFKKYLRDQDTRRLWSDAEIAMGEHLGCFSDDTISSYIDRIRDFELKMGSYLLKQQEAVSYDRKEEIKRIFSDFIFSSYKDVLNRRSGDLVLNRSNNHDYNFISFNYTNVLDRILNCTAESASVLRTRNEGVGHREDRYHSPYHVHGTLDDQIIMGVNDESQLNLSRGVTLNKRLKRKLIKPSLNTSSNHNWDVPAKKIIADSDIIYIYGVSYGKTDAVWWEAIHKWLKSNGGHKLVAFIRGNEADYFQSLLPWSEEDYEEDKRIRVLNNLGIQEDDPKLDELLNQIYIIRQTTRLNLANILFAKDCVATA